MPRKESRNKMPAKNWIARAVKAREAADRLSGHDARVAKRFAAECEYRATCLSEIQPSAQDCDSCPFVRFGKCEDYEAAVSLPLRSAA